MNPSSLIRPIARAALALALAAATASCEQGTDLFRLAVNGSPGGSFLSVWGSPSSPGAAYIAGGYVGVDHAMLPSGEVGRLVQYTRGTFTTLCRTDEVLWWVHGVTYGRMGETVVFAAGENGRVLRLEHQATACETLNVNVTYPEGAPTFWGIHAIAQNDVWFVGGSALPTGPRGVLVHYDGTTFTQEPNLPAEALRENLYKIDRSSDGSLFVVGSGGLLLRRDPTTRAWAVVPTNARRQDNRLFTVSCGPLSDCAAVGGAGSALFLRGALTSWETVPGLDDAPGLNGVYYENPSSVYLVGVSGVTIHYNGRGFYRPPMSLTSATLHGVGGVGGVVIAVGGEIDTGNPSQRGVILVRGDDSPTFTFDGTTYMATGNLRPSMGGFGQ